MLIEFQKAIPVVTEHGDGYAIYAESGGWPENDIWTIVLCEGGFVRHYRTDQIKIHHNATYGIIKSQ